MAQNNDLVSQTPLKNAVLCYTSIPRDVQTTLTDAAAQMGATSTLDLTVEVTHLLVGDISTPKYRYTAKSRPDMKVILPSFITAVRERWMTGGDVDIAALEKEHACPVFMGLRVCITGFDSLEERKALEDTIVSQRGEYHADLTKNVTHLVVKRCEGPKYRHGKQWGLQLVSIKWVEDSLKRGMALDESLYAPEMPEGKQGVDAFKSLKDMAQLGKRKSGGEDEESGKRKVRKMASARLENHSQELWGSMSVQEVQVENTELHAWDDDSQTLGRSGNNALQKGENRKHHSGNTNEPAPDEEPQGLFAGCYILIHGFNQGRAKLLSEFLTPNGAIIVQDVDELEAASEKRFFRERCLLLPHAKPDANARAPDVPPATFFVSEWWVERCIHYKQFLDPYNDPLSCPFWDVSGSELADLSIGTTGFDSVDLRQTAQAVRALGVAYQEQIIPSMSVIVAGSGTVRREKALYASKHKIPVVKQDWLWETLKARKKAPLEAHMLALPAFDPAELTPRALATSSPSASEVFRKSEEPKVKRLSNTRLRHTTPSLPLKASKAKPIARGPFIEEDGDVDTPGSLERSRPKSPMGKGPFIHKDEDVATPGALGEAPAQLDDTTPASLNTLAPLQEISPNASPKKSSQQAKRETTEASFANEQIRDSLDVAAETPEEPTPPPQSSLNDSLQALLDRQQKRSASIPSASKPLMKRKHRPLGRNLSTLSSRSNSAIAENSQGANMPTDDFLPVPEEEIEAPPSTMLSYEMPEAEARRKLMGKKLGVKDDDGEGVRKLRRIESEGTVIDEAFGGKAPPATGGGRRRRG